MICELLYHLNLLVTKVYSLELETLPNHNSWESLMLDTRSLKPNFARIAGNAL